MRAGRHRGAAASRRGRAANSVAGVYSAKRSTGLMQYLQLGKGFLTAPSACEHHGPGRSICPSGEHVL